VALPPRVQKPPQRPLDQQGVAGGLGAEGDADGVPLAPGDGAADVDSRAPSSISITASTPSRMRTSRWPASPSSAETFMPCRRITSARNLSSRPGLPARIWMRSGFSMRSRTVGAAVRAEA
jgi:hypothetical protein